MPTADRVTLIAAGAGAGIAATFDAPLGGVLFAVELLLVSIDARNLLLVTLATGTATYIGQLLLGTHPAFFIPALEAPQFYLERPLALLEFAVLGVLIGFLSVAFIRGIYAMEDVFDAIPGNYYTRHALGMACVGVMMVVLQQTAGHYYVQRVGYATILDVLLGNFINPWFLLLLMVLKLAATSLSLGSGASGGVFSPALFVGATGGAAFGLSADPLPWPSPMILAAPGSIRRATGHRAPQRSTLGGGCTRACASLARTPGWNITQDASGDAVGAFRLARAA